MRFVKAFGALILYGVCCLPLSGQASSSAQGPQSNQVSLRIIVVSTPEEAQRIADQLKKGEDFAVLAKEKSSDPTADSGGYMGTLDPSTLRTELKDALSRLSPGQTSPIAHIPEGYAILKVLSPYAAKEMENASRDRLSALSGVGAVKYTPNVSGIGEAESALFRSPKPEGWGQDLREVCESRKQTLANATKRMEDLLAPSNAAALTSQAPLDVTQEYYALGELYAYSGKMDRAIEQYLNAYKLAQSRASDAVPQFEQELGIAYLHKSEIENGIYQNPDDRCLFPLRPGAEIFQTGRFTAGDSVLQKTSRKRSRRPCFQVAPELCLHDCGRIPVWSGAEISDPAFGISIRRKCSTLCRCCSGCRTQRRVDGGRTDCR